MSTVKFDTWRNPDNTENFKVRAWVNFNGAGTVAIRASGNVSSITDNGVGDFTVNFAVALPDANYAVTAGASNGSTSRLTVAGTVFSTGSVRIDCNQPAVANQDPGLACVVIHR